VSWHVGSQDRRRKPDPRGLKETPGRSALSSIRRWEGWSREPPPLLPVPTAFVTNKAAQNTENQEEICPKIPKPLASAALQTEVQQACGCEERAWVLHYFRASHFAAQKACTSTGDLHRKDHIHLSAGFLVLMLFPPFPWCFLVQQLRVDRSTSSHMEMMPGRQKDKKAGQDVT